MQNRNLFRFFTMNTSLQTFKKNIFMYCGYNILFQFPTLTVEFTTFLY